MCIRDRRWKEITFGLRQVILGIHPFAQFTFKGLIDFLIQVEYEVDYLGVDPEEKQKWADFIYFMLIQPGEDENIPTSLAEWLHIEHQQMRALLQEEPKMERYGRVRTMWVWWVDAFGIVFTRGWHGSWLKMRELVDSEEDIGYASMGRLRTEIPRIWIPTPKPRRKRTYLWSTLKFSGYNFPWMTFISHVHTFLIKHKQYS